MATQFDTSAYVRSHGKQPLGRGSWAFCPDASCDAKKAVFSPSMTLVDAKKWFKRNYPDAVTAYVAP